MTRHTWTLLEEHRATLQRTLLRDEKEYAALILCGRSSVVDPWTGVREERFVTHKVIEVDPSAFSSRSRDGLTWSTTPFYNLLKAAEEKNFAVGVIHSHPQGPLKFSKHDDVADKELFRIAFDRLDGDGPHFSAVMDGNGNLIARAYSSNLKPFPVEFIRVIGDRWRFHYPRATQPPAAELDRQARAFGEESTHDLRQLRVGIVGCGGMGSAVIALLARIGVGKLAFFDFDRIEETNLNRVHFSTRADASLRRHKVDVMAEAVAQLGLPVSLVRVPYTVDDPRARDALLSCDVLLGCTDDHLGRNVLNRVAHCYLFPVIDLGLLIEPNSSKGYDVFDGRVTVVQPGYPCQECRGLINPSMMLAEALLRKDPLLYEQRRRAGYIPSMPEASPVVVTFTTEMAAVAVNELFQRLTGFRGTDGSVAERVRKFDETRDFECHPAATPRPDCKLCGNRKYDGRGDMPLFLDIAP